MIFAGYDCLITINGTGISGATISSISNNSSVTLISKLGSGLFTKDNRGNQIPNEFDISSFSITKPLCISGGEPLKYLLDTLDSVSGTIQTDFNSISFESGYLTKYNVNYSLDEGPNVTMEFSVYGRIGNNRVNSPQYFTGGNHFAKRSLIDLNISGAYGSINDFNYSIEVPFTPITQLGQKYPIEVINTQPKKFDIRAQGYIEDDENFLTNKFLENYELDYVYLDLIVYGGTSGNVLLDRQSGFFQTTSKDVSISVDDEFTFSIEATKYF